MTGVIQNHLLAGLFSFLKSNYINKNNCKTVHIQKYIVHFCKVIIHEAEHNTRKSSYLRTREFEEPTNKNNTNIYSSTITS